MYAAFEDVKDWLGFTGDKFDEPTDAYVKACRREKAGIFKRARRTRKT